MRLCTGQHLGLFESVAFFFQTISLVDEVFDVVVVAFLDVGLDGPLAAL